jgi:hypothetical protein
VAACPWSCRLVVRCLVRPSPVRVACDLSARYAWPFLFLWLLVAPLILYLVAALLFPTNQDDVVVTSWRQHYYANNEKIFALFGLTFAIDLVDTLLKGVTYFLSLGPLYYGSMLMQIALCGIAATTKSPRYHAFFAVFYLVYNLAMLGSNLLRLM